MKNKKPRSHPIAEAKYKEAFILFFKCNYDDFEIKPVWENGPMIANYKGEIYKIDNEYDVNKNIENLLTDVTAAFEIPIYQWIDVAEDVHLESAFYSNLLSKLTIKEEFENLNLALNINSKVKSAESFWLTLFNLDEIGVYSKAIVAAAETYDLNLLVSELSELIILQGYELLNEKQKGIFETVDLRDDYSHDNNLFYIYSLDENWWSSSE